MRVVLTLDASDTRRELAIPLDFRRHFLSLLKTVLTPSPVFKRFAQEKPGFSPYVMHVGFSGAVRVDRLSEQMTVRLPLRVVLSTGDMEWFAYLCNGAIALQGQSVVLGLKLRMVDIDRPQALRAGVAALRICGHACFRRDKEWNKDPYAGADDLAAVEASLNHHAKVKAGFLREEWGIQTEYLPVRVLAQSQLHKGVCTHYGGKLTTVQGRIVADGDAASLQFLYDYGLGSRSGQGFGMVEVV